MIHILLERDSSRDKQILQLKMDLNAERKQNSENQIKSHQDILKLEKSFLDLIQNKLNSQKIKELEEAKKLEIKRREEQIKKAQ